MDVSISLLSVTVLHLSILVFAFKKYDSLLKKMVPLYFSPIFFCLITTITYLLKKELNHKEISIYGVIVVTNIPRCLLIISIVITFLAMLISWIIIFNFLGELAKKKKKEMSNHA